MCGGGGIDAGVVMRAIQDAEVQKALSLTTPPLFGRDNRPVDGTVFQFLRGDGRGFLVGTACDAAVRDCVAVPAGIDRLVTTLRDLDRQQLRDPSCAGLVTTGVR
jgi:hypothetical protein